MAPTRIGLPMRLDGRGFIRGSHAFRPSERIGRTCYTCVSRLTGQNSLTEKRPLTEENSLTEKRVDKRGGLERCQIIGALPEPDQLDGHTEFLLHAKDDSALRRSVQLGQHDASDVDDFSEHAGL